MYLYVFRYIDCLIYIYIIHICTYSYIDRKAITYICGTCSNDIYIYISIYFYFIYIYLMLRWVWGGRGLGLGVVFLVGWGGVAFGEKSVPRDMRSVLRHSVGVGWLSIDAAVTFFQGGFAMLVRMLDHCVCYICSSMLISCYVVREGLLHGC